MNGMTAVAEAASPIYEAALRWVEGEFGAARRARCLADEAKAAAIWAELAALGLLGVSAPEAAGGVEGGPEEIAAVARAFGRGGMSEAWIPVAVAAASILSECGEAALLADLVAGKTRPAPAWTEPGRGWARTPGAARLDAAGRLSGAKTVVWGGALADRLIVSARGDGGAPALVLVSASAAAEVRRYRMWDGGDAAEFAFVAAPAERVLATGAAAAHALDRALDLAALAMASEAVGAMERAIELTREHLKTRVQFGRPLSANQALRHRLTECWCEKELARALVQRAAREFETGGAAERSRIVAAAKAMAGEAGRLVANETVQMHGAIGVTEEAEIARLHRRLLAIDLTLGAAPAQLTRFRAA